VTAADHRTYFRSDIEGLRAVAIGVVLLYHAGVPAAQGGFIGVDVFFVISGFLITGLLLREWRTDGRIDLQTFYARRFRRLLPAALLTIVVTVIASWLILSNLRFPGVAGDAASAALYVSNIRFATNAIDYLGAEVAPSPILHFWSLSVEEQYYLFWPLIVLLSLRLLALRRFGFVVLAMIVVSFAAALLWTDLAAPWAFFSLPTRAWELGVGALIAVGLLRLPQRTPPLLTASLVWIGLAVIGAGVLVIGPGTPYPGTAALIPVVGTALAIIGGGAAETLPSRLLAMRVPRWIGRISYSLYLWHWPLLVLVPITLGVDSLALNLALVGVAVVIAAASTELVEVPIRSGRALPAPPRTSLIVAGSASLVVAIGAVTAGAVVLGPATPPAVAEQVAPLGGGELPSGVLAGPVPVDLVPGLKQAYWDLPAGYDDGCHLDYPDVDLPACAYGVQDGQRSVLLVGDSHAQQWLPALQRLADERGWRLRAITKSGCPLVEATVWNSSLKRAYRECDEWRARVLQAVDDDAPDVVLVASADMYDIVAEDGGLLKDGAGGAAAEAAAWDAGLARSLSALAERAPGVVAVLADTPRVGYDPADCLATKPDVGDCDASRERMVDEGYAAREAAAADEAGVAVIPTADWVCTEDACPLVRGPYLVFRDAHHLTATFAAQLAPRLGAAIDALLQEGRTHG
jgi:peptidoglycan/LPS O-acetylase OafA/YrhL